MAEFHYRDGVLHAEAVNLEALAEAVGTPFYCYSEAALRRRFRNFRDAFAGLDPLIAYSVKANGNLSLLRILREEGAGADIVSGGELARALAAGAPPHSIVFSGVGKTRAEMAAALDSGIFQFNVESEPELFVLADVAAAKGVRAPVAVRVNPDVEAGGHAKISTGKAEDKFGLPPDRALALYRRASTLDCIALKGLAVHIGSQIDSLAPFGRAFARLADLARTLRAEGFAIDRLDLGGGLGVPYGPGDDPPSPADYAALIRRLIAPLGVALIVEPGRAIAAEAGILVMRILYVKEGARRTFLIVDAGMNDFIRPALYEAAHDIMMVRPRAGEATLYDVVGPVCESSDRFAKGRLLPPAVAGDLLALRSAGAYGACLASQYNARPLIPETLVRDAQPVIIRRRPDAEDMLALEREAAAL
jgi:diaminopimelate decarboxylase